MRAVTSHEPRRAPPIGPSATTDAAVPPTATLSCVRSREPDRSRKSSSAPVLLPKRCAYPPLRSVASSMTSLFTIATDPVLARSSMTLTVCSRKGVWKPSTVKFMCPKSLPRTLNSLLRSSPVATPGSTWTARSGSSARTPRRTCISALPRVCWAVAPGSAERNGAAVTVTVSVYVPVPPLRGIRRSDGVALGEVQAALDEDVAHDRHRQPDAAPRQPTQLEGPRLGGQRLCLVVHAHADTSERLPGLRIDDLSLDQRALRRDRLLIADSTHRREEDDGENCNRGHKSVTGARVETAKKLRKCAGTPLAQLGHAGGLNIYGREP